MPVTCRMITVFLVLAAMAWGCEQEKKAVSNSSKTLIGTTWRLQAFVGAGQEIPAAAEVETTIEFKADSSVGGQGGCNRYFSQYVLKGDSLKLGPVGATRMMCPEPQMAQEDRYFAVLDRVAGFRMENGKLVLLDRDGQRVLVFAAVAE